MKKNRLSILFFAAAIFGAAYSRADGWPANYGGVMLQGFYWDSDGSVSSGYPDTKWTTLESKVTELSDYFDIIWIPNAAKSSGTMGYLPQYWFSNYNTSFGTEAQLRSMVNTFKAKGLNVIGDLVLNHRVGVNSWADFPSETWNGTSYLMDNSCVCRTDEWASNGGNPTGANDQGDDFYGGRDLDHTGSTVQTHCKAYCKFLLDDLGYAGFRLDMVKGYSGYYTKMYNQYAKPRFSVGEYWDGYDNIANWIETTGKESAAFDFPFKYALNNAMNSTQDMSELCWLANGTDPQPAGLIHYNYRRYAVTFIDNHDTFRNENKFIGNVEAANAMMLCSPGTPCVFYPHWEDSKDAIRKMIAIRKAVGVTNTSTVNVLRHDASCYMAEVTGNHGKLVVKIGSAMVSPSGYSDSQIRASGSDWCIWTDISVDASTAPGPVDSGEYTIYWDNSSAAWTTPKVHYFGGVESSSWPGVSMTKVNGTGNVYQLSVAPGTTGLVFNNGSGTQTDDQAAIPNHLYGLTGDKGIYTGGDTGSSGGSAGDEGDDSGSNMTVYFDNRIDSWASVKFYTGTGWPGSDATHCYNTIWKCTIPKTSNLLIFNDGGSGYGHQTGDIEDPNANYIYYNTGNDGSILPSKIYIMGTVFNDAEKHWKPNQGIELTKSGNVYRGVVTVYGGDSGIGSFSFVQVLASTSGNSGWDTCNSLHRYGATGSSQTVIPDNWKDMAVYPKGGDTGSAKSWAVMPGNYYVTADFNNMNVKLATITVNLDSHIATLNTDETITLTTTVTPEDIPGQAVIWESSDTSVATVSTTGKVTAVGEGTVTISAHYGPVSDECTVYVGKTRQSILWSQELSTMCVGQKINPTATATSGLNVSYVVTTGNDSVVTRNANGEIEAVGPGIAVIEAFQEGDSTYAPAEPVAKTVTVTLDYIPGDTNGDDAVTTADATATVSYILTDTDSREEMNFNTRAADINGDNLINVADVSLILNLILSQAPLEPEAAVVASEKVDMMTDGDDLMVWWSNMSDYVSGQFDVLLPEGVEVTGASVEGGVQSAAFRMLPGNVCRVAVYSLLNVRMGADSFVRLRLSSPCRGEVKVCHAWIDDIEEGLRVTKRPASPASYNLEGVSDVPADVSADTQVSVYGIDGICVYQGTLAGFNKGNYKGVMLMHGAGFSARFVAR